MLASRPRHAIDFPPFGDGGVDLSQEDLVPDWMLDFLELGEEFDWFGEVEAVRNDELELLLKLMNFFRNAAENYQMQSDKINDFLNSEYTDGQTYRSLFLAYCHHIVDGKDPNFSRTLTKMEGTGNWDTRSFLRIMERFLARLSKTLMRICGIDEVKLTPF